MRARLTPLLRALRGFRHNAEGVAAIEFALVFPVMLLVYLGTMEASTLISADRRVQTVAAAVGDLVSRAKGKIPACDIKDYFKAASGIMQPYDDTALQQVVTSVHVAADGTTLVEWSKSEDGSGTYTVGATYPLPQAMKDIALDAHVIVSEASYAYPPITGFIYDQPIQLRRENFYLPRYGGSIVVDPTSTASCP